MKKIPKQDIFLEPLTLSHEYSISCLHVSNPVSTFLSPHESPWNINDQHLPQTEWQHFDLMPLILILKEKEECFREDKDIRL